MNLQRQAAKPALKPLTPGKSVYHNLKTRYKESGNFPAPSFLRVDQVLANNKSRYKFDIKAASTDAAPELRLDRNDLFVATHIGIFLVAQDRNKKGREVLQSYPNQVIFPAAAGFDPEDLEAIYNGFLTMKVGSTVNIESLSMQNFRKVPQTQQSASTNRSQWNLKDQCYKPETTLELHGTANIDIEVEFPTYNNIKIAYDGEGTIDHKIAMLAFGYLVKNGAAPLNK